VLMPGSDRVADYWSSYYGKQEGPMLPSQFAVFIANELATGDLPRANVVYDIGCGNGRDAMFFQQLGYHVRGLDGSEEAIAACKLRQAQAKGLLSSPATGLFVTAQADSAAAWQDLSQGNEGPVIVYSRFFFHAIDEETQLAVLGEVAKVLRCRGGAFCAEFRTPEDRDAMKETPAHYRRFIDPVEFAAQVKAVGLTPIWQADGRGMAKHRRDDACVARLIAVP
jgi:SAM-dependent methyltransferase